MWPEETPTVMTLRNWNHNINNDSEIKMEFPYLKSGTRESWLGQAVIKNFT